MSESSPDAASRQFAGCRVSPRPTSRRRSARVDVVAALAALRRSVIQRPTGTSACPGDPPGTLLDAALDDLGVTIAQFSSCGHVGEHQCSRAPQGRAEPTEILTLGAAIALRAADRAQRAGESWGASVPAAEQAVIALLDIVPSTLLRAVTDRSDIRQQRNGVGR